MILRYGDGRPDIPIPPSEPMRSRSRRRDDPSPTSPVALRNPNYRQRSESHVSSPLAQSHPAPGRSEQPPPFPEEIRVLPSHANEALPSSSSHHPRSTSLPRTADPHSRANVYAPPPPPVPQFPPHAPLPPGWHHHRGHPHKAPPAIVYAPSHHSRTHYAPPAMYHYPPQMGPNGMIYSHSAPVNQKKFAQNMASVPYPHNAVHPSYARENMRAGMSRGGVANYDRTRSSSARRGARFSPSSSSSSLSSEQSGGTYYVLPNEGQKVHVIVSHNISGLSYGFLTFRQSPSPERSVETATSTTRSHTTPLSATFKKPFLQRLFSFARFSSVVSSRASSTGRGRRLQRRHSTGGSVRPRPGVP